MVKEYNALMDAQQIFYVIATISLALFSLALIAVIYLSYRLQKFLKSSILMLDLVSKNVSESLTTMTKTWGTLTLTRMIIGTIGKLIRRRL